MNTGLLGRVRHPIQQLLGGMLEKYEKSGLLEAIDSITEIAPQVVSEWEEGRRLIPPVWIVRIKGALEMILENPGAYPQLVLKPPPVIPPPDAIEKPALNTPPRMYMGRESKAHKRRVITPTHDEQLALEDRMRKKGFIV